MFGSWKIRMLEDEKSFLQRRLDKAEASVAAQKVIDHENRTWVEQGKGTGIKTLEVAGGRLLRLEDGRTYFLPKGQVSYPNGWSSGSGQASFQQIIPL